MVDFNDELMFAAEDAEAFQDQNKLWKVLVVDDEEEVHRVTTMVLEQVQFDGKGLHFIHAYSGSQALEMIRSHPDIALIFLDVVMETDDAGLRVAREIRETLCNIFTRIILRTGQPGQAPEDRVIVDYDINDYKLKTELTFTKLFTTVVTSLRSYRDIMTIEHQNKGLQILLNGAPRLYKRQSISAFMKVVLHELGELLIFKEPEGLKQGFSSIKRKGAFVIVAGMGSYAKLAGKDVLKCAPPEVCPFLADAILQKRTVYREKELVGFLPGADGTENLFYVKGSEPLTAFDRDLLEIFLSNIRVAHTNILLSKEIEDTQSEVIFTLGEVAESRSKETGRHVRRVAEYSFLLARKLGLPEEEAETLRQASPMHDVGKLGIPDAILHKPGKLDAAEWAVMKTHANLGQEILRNSNRMLMKAAAIAAGQHHEKWDGTGYPKGLKGEEIHIFGRITAVADVFDALTVRRIYKDAWPIEEVIAFFHRESKLQFDPALVTILMENLDEFLTIMAENTSAWERGETEEP